MYVFDIHSYTFAGVFHFLHSDFNFYGLAGVFYSKKGREGE